MTRISIHGVTAIELSNTYVENENSRTLRVTSRDHDGVTHVMELTVYGNTNALDTLPWTKDFTAYIR